MAKPGDPIRWPAAPCCWPDYPAGCVCPPAERALRGWKRGALTESMSTDQREFCLDEVDRVEGYRRSDHENDSDADLAGAVLGAWLDYCQDKGLR